VGIFASNENRIKCGECNAEFDLNKNNEGCPICIIEGRKKKPSLKQEIESAGKGILTDYLAIPAELKLSSGKLILNEGTKLIGTWGMFNSFFPGKAVLRILANMMYKNKIEYTILDDLINKSAGIFKANGFSKLRGFPNDPEKQNSIGRLVYHFIKTFNEMGFFLVKAKEENKGDVWDEPWKNIEITLTKEGLDFAKLPNRIFDDHEPIQVLTTEEKVWLLKYLKKIDEAGYKEFYMLINVFEFIKKSNNGKEELWAWYRNNSTFRKYVQEWSRKSGDREAFEKQIANLAPTFAAGKVALLRELGVIKNRRNDYTIIGNL